MSASRITNPASRQNKTRPTWLNRVVIRHVVEPDLPAIEWEGEYSRYRRNYAEAFERSKNGKAVMWVMDLAGYGLVGQAFVQLTMSDQTSANGKTRAYLHSFRVRPAMRGLGLGSRLMFHIERDLLRRGFREITLNVAEDNEGALRLYKRLGYSLLKRIPGNWSYRDDTGKLQHVQEPGFQLIKRLKW